MIERIELSTGTGVTPYEIAVDGLRAFNKRQLGGDDVPIVGLGVLDFRQAGDRDILPLGTTEIAPDPVLYVDVPAFSASTTRASRS